MPRRLLLYSSIFGLNDCVFEFAGFIRQQRCLNTKFRVNSMRLRNIARKLRNVVLVCRLADVVGIQQASDGDLISKHASRALLSVTIK